MNEQQNTKIRARAFAILGTGSDVGKSLVTAGLCRLFFRAGVRVAPFKAQNMALNSFVTPEGGEMGRAQVLQAQACGLKPHVDMNPILLKPEADCRSQVIVQGKVWNTQDAQTYFRKKSDLMKIVEESYERLARRYEVLMIEGAGSAAEMNLRERDLVNWPVVNMADASVILVADIDRGGVFAQIIGTMDLLASEERRRVIGFVINKFRGDVTLFEDGVRMIEERTGVPVLGVLPYLKGLDLDQEDSVVVDRYASSPFGSDMVNVAVLLLPHMSNFTDFNPLAAEPDVVLRYVRHPKDLDGADVVILPGSKTTMTDFAYVQQEGFQEAIAKRLSHGVEVVGICGGFQMLGQQIRDPQGVEGGGTIDGFGLLDLTTELLPEKKTIQVTARPLHDNIGGACVVEGYEIHMGVTTGACLRSCFHVTSRNESQFDGYMRDDGLVWGTYIHGLFDRPGFRRLWLNRIRVRKNLQELDITISEAVSQRLSQEIDRWADHVETHLNVDPLFSHMKLKPQCVIECGLSRKGCSHGEV
ncbi:MAG: cobyric acid synthase [Nitrospirales bacterium]|nr:cobyric acid synthase [Nitrospira sp.]MDR4502229.1 cobyric acid synthase [Nitrospirales bacterium]